MRRLLPVLLMVAVIGCGKKPVAEGDPPTSAPPPAAEGQSGPTPNPSDPPSANPLPFDKPTLDGWEKARFYLGGRKLTAFGEVIDASDRGETPDAIPTFIHDPSPVTTLGAFPKGEFAVDLRTEMSPLRTEMSPRSDLDPVPPALLHSLPNTPGADKVVGLGMSIKDPALLAVVKGLPNLRFLAVNISEVAFAAADWSAIADLPNLKVVDITLYSPQAAPGALKLSALKPIRATVSVTGKLSAEAATGVADAQCVSALRLQDPSAALLTALANAPGLRKLTVTAGSPPQGLRPADREAIRKDLAAQFAPVANLKHLTSLELVYGGSADAFLAAASSLPELTELSVGTVRSYDPVSLDPYAPTAETVARIGQLTKLRRLKLEGAYLPKDGLKCLTPLANLTSLDISRTAWLSSVLAVPGLADRLTDLTLEFVYKEDWPRFAELKSLRQLRVSIVLGSETAAEHLSKLTRLQRLRVDDINLFSRNDRRLDQFIRAMPDCSVNGNTPYSKMSKEERDAVSPPN